jgi:hypothetical protein
MVVCVFLLGSSLNVHAKPERLRASRDKIGISVDLLKVSGRMSCFSIKG